MIGRRVRSRLRPPARSQLRTQLRACLDEALWRGWPDRRRSGTSWADSPRVVQGVAIQEDRGGVIVWHFMSEAWGVFVRTICMHPIEWNPDPAYECRLLSCRGISWQHSCRSFPYDDVRRRRPRLSIREFDFAARCMHSIGMQTKELAYVLDGRRSSSRRRR